MAHSCVPCPPCRRFWRKRVKRRGWTRSLPLLVRQHHFKIDARTAICACRYLFVLHSSSLQHTTCTWPSRMDRNDVLIGAQAFRRGIRRHWTASTLRRSLQRVLTAATVTVLQRTAAAPKQRRQGLPASSPTPLVERSSAMTAVMAAAIVRRDLMSCGRACQPSWQRVSLHLHA